MNDLRLRRRESPPHDSVVGADASGVRARARRGGRRIAASGAASRSLMALAAAVVGPQLLCFCSGPGRTWLPQCEPW